MATGSMMLNTLQRDNNTASPLSFEEIEVLPFSTAGPVPQPMSQLNRPSLNFTHGSQDADPDQFAQVATPALFLTQVPLTQRIEADGSMSMTIHDTPVVAQGHSDSSHELTSSQADIDSHNDVRLRAPGTAANGLSTGLEDYAGVDLQRVDRYGFYPQQIQRRLSSSSLTAARTRASNLRRKNTMGRNSLKRASMQLGISNNRDYLEPSGSGEISSQKEVTRAQKWMSMASRQSGDDQFKFVITSKLIDRVYKGIPDCWRAPAWHSFLMDDATIGNKHTLQTDRVLIQQYAAHCQARYELDDQIDLDVPRTISGHVLFRRRHEGGQLLLFRVLHAISLQFPTVGYVQGMASLAATLLCFYPEDQTFVMLCRLWTSRSLIELYRPGFPLLMESFKLLEEKLQQSAVGRHLLSIGCAPISWATRWYLTLFHTSLPFRTQLRIWDLFMLNPNKQPSECFKILEATTLALLDGMSTLLLCCEFDQAMRLLTMPIDVHDDDTLMRAIRKRMK